MLALGITTGFAAAVCQSCSYLATRHYVQRRPAGASKSLLVLAHVWMGPICLALLTLYWNQIHVNWSQAIWPVVGEVFFYVLGQSSLILALKYAEPSRVSPLLSFKLVVLALLTTIFAHEVVNGWQWLAVMICVLGGLSLYRSGGKMHKIAALAMILACVANALCDWCIALLLRTFPVDTPKMAQSMFSMALCYGICAVIAVPLLPWVRYPSWRDWRGAAPFALCWIGGMIFLFLCFSYVGPVYGNILQSTRGLISIFMSWALIRLGAGHIEPSQGKGALISKLVAGTLMVIAVGLYAVARGR